MDAGTVPADIKAVNKITEKSSHSVSYSADTISSWGAKDNISKAKSRPSATGSLYYTASESEGRSEIGSVYDAVSLPDSDEDFQVEVETASKATGGKETPESAEPVILFEGAGLGSTSAAAAGSPDEEFDYAFADGKRQGETYQRVYQAQPPPPHLITPLHQAHLGSLAEESEEGSDQVSESDGGLIHDDDTAAEPSPAPSAALDQGAAASTSSVAEAAPRHRKTASAAGVDGMFELDMDSDFEQTVGRSSFAARAAQPESAPAASTSQGQLASSAQAASTSGKGAASKAADNEQSTSGAAQQAQRPQQAQQAQQPMPDSVPVDALSPVPILSPVPTTSTSAIAAVKQQPIPANSTEEVDLEDIDLGEAKAQPGPSKASAKGQSKVPAEGQATTDEWEEVNLARAREMAVDAPSGAMPGDKVRYQEALDYFLSANVKAIKKTLPKQRLTQRLASCFMRTTKSNKRLEKERTRLLCLAKMPFDDSDIMHLRLLQSVYLTYTGEAGPVSRYGAHWAKIGFQGNDPSTDLRGCGILGLLHLLLLHEHDPANAQAISKLFKETDFPLAAVSLNVTKWTLQMVRERRLSSAAKKQQSAVTAASDFYIGAFYALFTHWKDNNCTMADSGDVLKDVEKLACSHKLDMITKAGTKL